MNGKGVAGCPESLLGCANIGGLSSAARALESRVDSRSCPRGGLRRGAPCFTGSCSEIYFEKAFDGFDFRPAQPLPVARVPGETSLGLLSTLRWSLITSGRSLKRCAETDAGRGGRDPPQSRALE